MGRNSLRWLLALGLLGGLSCGTALTAQAASPVWAIRGAHNTVYLAGSIHLLPPQDASLPPAFDRAYADSAKLVMELDLGKLDELAAAGWILQHGALPAGTRLRKVIGEERYARVSAAAADLGLTSEILDGQAPWVVGIELADLEYAHLGFDPQQGVEEQLVHRAQADHKPTGGLETIDEQLGGLEALSHDDQLHMLDQTLDELKDSQTELQDVLHAWRRGDTPRLAALLSKEYRAFPALYRPLVTERNAHWLPHIEEALRGRDNCLIVVGALHLVGEGGLLQLLRKDGYTTQQMN